jgi:hypothetical protein
MKIYCSSCMCREVVAKGANVVLMMISAKWWVDPWRQQFSNIFRGSIWISFNPSLSTFRFLECPNAVARTCFVSINILSSCVHIIQGCQESRLWQESESNQLNVQHKK